MYQIVLKDKIIIRHQNSRLVFFKKKISKINIHILIGKMFHGFNMQSIVQKILKVYIFMNNVRLKIFQWSLNLGIDVTVNWLTSSYHKQVSSGQKQNL